MAGAAAEVPGESLADLVFRGLGLFIQESLGSQGHARGAAATGTQRAAVPGSGESRLVPQDFQEGAVKGASTS